MAILGLRNESVICWRDGVENLNINNIFQYNWIDGTELDSCIFQPHQYEQQREPRPLAVIAGVQAHPRQQLEGVDRINGATVYQLTLYAQTYFKSLLQPIQKYLSLHQELQYESQSSETYISTNSFTTHFKYSLLKLLASIIQKKLFITSDSQKLYDQLSYALIFKQCLFSLILSLLSQGTNFVVLQKLINFHKNLQSQQHILFLPIQIYYLFGGGLFTIQARVFRERITNMIESIGRVLSTSDTVINRNIEQYKGNKERNSLLQESVKIVMIAKNKQALAEVVNFVAQPIFGAREYLQRQEFLFQLQSRPLDPILSIFLQLVRSQSLLFQERSFRSGLLIRNEITKTNFYATQITKLFNKCPFNGDDRCSCKKCQCVRRNRQSAKLSQQKKRNAVQQVQVLKARNIQLELNDKKKDQRILQLQKKARTQQEQIMMLKTMIKAMKSNPNIKSLMMETIEPVSKALNNDF